ncbi:MAG: hypothetical protein R3Y13_04140 [bacterium]
MKESYGGMLLFNIVILFILLFTGIMCLTINRTNAYQVKDMIITIIEDYNGIDLNNTAESTATNEALDEIVAAVTSAAYRTVGTCPDGYTSLDRGGSISSNASSICLKRVNVDFTENLVDNYTYAAGEKDKGCYYSTIVFYKLDIPVINQIFSFKIMGETKMIFSDLCEV